MTLKRFGKLVLVALTVSTVVPFLTLLLLQRHLLFPRHAIPEVVIERPGDVEHSWTEEQGSEIWFFKGRGEKKRKPIVFYAHGNGGLIEHCIEEARFYQNLGYHVVLVEYPGYGRSGGEPSEDSIRDAFVVAFDQIAARDDVDINEIVFHGQSMGGGALTSLAKKRPPTRLILESTYTSIEQMADEMFPGFSLFVRDPFRTDLFLESANIPVLLIHGQNDGLIPIHHAEENHQTAKQSELVVLTGAHMLARNQKWRQAISKFLSAN